MRILHLVESLERGGLERVVVDLALAQQAAGHVVAVCCLFRQGALAGELQAGGIRVSSAEKRNGLDVRALRRIRRALVQLDADVLHTHNVMANYYGALASPVATGVRIVNTRHGTGFMLGSGPKERLFRCSLLRTAVVTMVCQKARDSLVARRIVPRRLARVVHNGIRVEAFAHGSPAARVAARAALGVPDAAFLVGTVGRLNAVKDHALLIDAFARLSTCVPHARLVVIGEGERRPALAAQVERLGLQAAVLLTGDRGDVPALLPAFDVFALTSLTEGYSIALLEAAAAGLPVVASDVGGNREIVQDGATGLIVAERTAEAHAQSLGRLVDAPDLRARLGRQARVWVEEHGTVAAMTRGYEAAYAGARGRP